MLVKFVATLVCLILVGCNVHVYRDATGKRRFVREFPDTKKAWRKRYRRIFAKPNLAAIPIEQKAAISDGRDSNGRYVQTDSVRCYLPIRDSTFDFVFKIGVVDLRGLLCLQEPSCISYGYVRNSSTDTFVVRPVKIDNRNFFRLAAIELLQNAAANAHQRRFKLSLAPEYGHGYTILFLELTNAAARSNTPLPEFVKQAHTSVVRFGWFQI